MNKTRMLIVCFIAVTMISGCASSNVRYHTNKRPHPNFTEIGAQNQQKKGAVKQKEEATEQPTATPPVVSKPVEIQQNATAGSNQEPRLPEKPEVAFPKEASDKEEGVSTKMLMAEITQIKQILDEYGLSIEELADKYGWLEKRAAEQRLDDVRNRRAKEIIVGFEEGISRINETVQTNLDEFIKKYRKDRGKITLEVIGVSSLSGSKARNKLVASNRAKNVSTYLEMAHFKTLITDSLPQQSLGYEAKTDQCAFIIVHFGPN